MATYRPGHQIGDWTIVDLLDKGGNSDVWRAIRGGQEVALKILRVKNADKEPYKRFLSEVRLHSSLEEEDGVLPLLDSEVPSRPTKSKPAWLATPIATPIKEALGEGPTIDEVVKAIVEIAQTLARLHEKGIHHRDVKPGNLFLYKDRWVVGDFGLADFPDKAALTDERRRLGPIYYIAPEMLNEPTKSAGGPADVYSLAKTLWVLASGRNFPLQGEIRRDMHRLRLSDSVAHDRVHLLDRLLEASTRNDPASRPSMYQLSEELAAWLREPADPQEGDVSDLVDRVTSLMGPALGNEARMAELVAEGTRSFQRVYDHLGVIAERLRGLKFNCNVTIGRGMNKYTKSLLVRSQVTGSTECLWENYAVAPVKAPKPFTAHLWVAAGCQVFDDGSADIAAAYVLGAHDFPQDYAWSRIETIDPGSAFGEMKVAEMIAGLDEEFALAVKRFMELARGRD